MKTVNAIKLVQEIRDLESSRLEYIENYEEPQFNHCWVAHGYAEEAREVFNRRMHNHKVIVSNARDRIDALDLALRALTHFDVNT